MTDDRDRFQLPVGTVTFLLGDLEGSTRLWDKHRSAMTHVIARVYEIVDEKVAGSGGVRPIEQGEGDSVVAAFARASDALSCALEIQLALQEEDWPEDLSIKMRLGLHTGEAELRDEGNYFGQSVIRGARLRSTGHGGQILASQVVRDLVSDSLPEGIALRDLGLKRLRDLSRPERVYQVCHPQLPSDFPPLTSLDELPNNLPIQLTTFIGREKEIDEIKNLLESTRLLTLIGSGGCGKTRLVLQVGAETIDRYPDGVWWVDLAPISDPGLVPNAVAAALSVREAAMQELPITIANHLGEQHALIVLDNCEHLLSSSSDLVEVLLQSCSGIAILATSREPLGLPGETTWRVPSLTLPPERAAISLEALTQFEAVRLFIDRAVKARPNFTVTNENAPAVSEVCHRLDGIPLAIELAAARTRVLTISQIAEGLADRFGLLTGGARTALPRQRTLEASVDWSYNVLEPNEKILLNRLSVFAGGFTLDTAEAVGAGDGIERIQVLDLVSQLVDKSLIQMDEVHGNARYHMLETIRHFARQKLSETGEAATVRSRHLELFASLVESAEPHLGGAGQREWAQRLDVENDNLRAAADWGLHSDQIDPVLGMCGPLYLFWSVRGLMSEGLRLCRSALASGQGGPSSRAKALITAAGCAAYLIESADTKAFGEEALELSRSLEDTKLIGRSLCWLGWEKMFTDPIAGVSFFEQAVTACEAAGDPWFLAQSQIGHGFVLMQGGILAEAREQMRNANANARANGDYLNTRESLTWLSYLETFLGNFEEAERLSDDALSMMEEMKDEFFKTYLLFPIAWRKSLQGEYEVSRSLFEECIEMARKTSNLLLIPIAQTWQANFAVQLGDFEEARVLAAEALPALRDMDFKWPIAVALLALEGEAEMRGDLTEAKSYLDEAKQIASQNAIAYCLGRTWLIEARFAKAEESVRRAEDLQHQALALFVEAEELPGIILALEALAESACESGSNEEAARLLGATDSARASIGYVRFPFETEAHEGTLSQVRQSIGNDDTYAEGQGLSLQEAVSYAQRARGERKRPSSGWESLTPTELEVVRSVAKGLTNPQIGEKMFIAAGTVKVHLSHIFAKLGISTRSELAAEAVRRDI